MISDWVDELSLSSDAIAVLTRKRSEGERGNVEGIWAWGLRITWKEVEDNGDIRPLGGLTRNL